MLAAVKSVDNCLALVAVRSDIYDHLYLFEPGNKPNIEAISLLTAEFKSTGFKLKSVKAEQGLMQRLTEAYGGNFNKRFTLAAMRLDEVKAYPDVPGFCRPLNERDLHFAPYWQRACALECRIDPMSIKGYHRHSLAALEAKTRYIWDDNGPVAQAHLGTETQTGALIDDVYTPPYYRNKGYATALVAAVSQILLDSGKKYCVLFADAENATSCGIYRKVGYRDLCLIEEIEGEQELNKS